MTGLEWAAVSAVIGEQVIIALVVVLGFIAWRTGMFDGFRTVPPWKRKPSAATSSFPAVTEVPSPNGKAPESVP